MNRRPETTDHDVGCGRDLDAEITWFIENYTTCPKPFIPTLRQMFGLTASQACEVMRIANLRRWWRP